MNKIIKQWLSKTLLLGMAFSGIMISCEERGIVDVNYPEQEVYMPISRMGIYEVNDTTEWENPLARYIMDPANSKFLIPLGIYRSGVNCKGNVTIGLGTYNDTIADLIDLEAFNLETNPMLPEILPEESYQIPSVVEIKDGNDYAIFNLEIDLPFIQANLGKRYALSIKINESSKRVSDNYNTVIVDFDTRFTGARPLFNFKATKEDAKIFTFTNLSTYGLSYEWNFGDDQKSTDANPDVHVYDDFGTYTVSLTSTGIDGKPNVYIRDVVVWDVITNDYIKNPGNPFRRAGVVSTGRVDMVEGWDYTSNVLTTVTGGRNIGGWQGDANGVMDFYANPTTAPNGLKNAKIYQTFELEAGHYQFGFVQYSLIGENDCFAVVASGTGLPDIENMNSDADVLGKFNWNSDEIGDEKQEIEFTLNTKQTITVGFVITNQVRGRVKIREVSLAK
ncbi:MAG: DUF5013 domain-containing protein [Dysgonamonadaceae bacterium]|jgi:hypothetical protein|nr:DUF5013 domain-containing protein [Dysgonamonadaceae bacterium]